MKEKSAFDKFREILYALAKNQHSTTETTQLSKDLMQAFLDWGSETPDNFNCAKYIEYGQVGDLGYSTGFVDGLKITGKNILLSELMNVVEGIKIPKVVKETFPDLTATEWDAALRMTTMILIAMEGELYQPKAT